MSPEIQEWSHKSRSRINNPYNALNTCPMSRQAWFIPLAGERARVCAGEIP